MKYASLLFIIIVFSVSGMAQTYVPTPFPDNPGNPGGVRTLDDSDTTGGALALKLRTQTPTSFWSAKQTIPFPFEFNGTIEPKFVVTHNGLLSFDTTLAGQAAAPVTLTNASLPVAGLPDKTIAYFWEDFPDSVAHVYVGGSVHVSVEGFFPYRQLWVINSGAFGSAGRSKGIWAVVLEETTNSIYVVDMNVFTLSQYNISGTVGIQLDAATAFQIRTSPVTAFNIPNLGGEWIPANNDYYKFDFYPAGACVPSYNFFADNVTGSSADVMFDKDALTNDVDVEYGLTGYNIGSGTTVNTTTNSASLTSLTANTQYDVYLISNCSGVPSDTAGPFSFRTLCETVSTYPFVEDFNGPDWTTGDFGTLDPCWKSYNAPRDSLDLRKSRWLTGRGVYSGWCTGPLADYSGNGKYVFTLSDFQGTSTYLEMPEFDLSSLNIPELTYRYLFYGTDIGTMYIEGSTDNGITWTKLDSISGEQHSSSHDAWTLKVIDISAVKSASTRIRFSGESAGYCGYMAIDEVMVADQPACPFPLDVTGFNITSNSTDVTWTPRGAVGTFTVEWGPRGFIPGTGQTLNVSSDTAHVTGLTPDTEYDVYVLTDCLSTGNGMSTAAGPFTFFTALQPYYLQDFNGTFVPEKFFKARGAFGSASDWLVTAGDWTAGYFGNVAQNSRSARLPVAHAQSDWLVSPRIDLGTGNNYQLELDLSWDSLPTVADTVHVVISTDGGQTWQRSDILESFHILNRVPSDPGTHRVYDLSGYSGAISIGFNGGRASRYATSFFVDNFEVRLPPACSEPEIFDLISVTRDSVYFTFDADTSATGYLVESGPCGFTPGTNTPGAVYSDTIGIGNLTEATCYDLYIRTICSSDSSTWAGPFSFTTKCDTLPLPWTEGFENTATQYYPVCWDSSVGDTTNIGVADGSPGNPGSQGGSKYIYHQNHRGRSQWTFTPEFHLEAGKAYTFSFFYQVTPSAYIDELEVAYGTGQSQADMTNVLYSATNVDDTLYTSLVCSFIPMQTGTYNFGIRTKTAFSRDLFQMDDFELKHDSAACPNVSSLSSAVVDQNEVDLSWSSVVAHTSYDIEWGPQGFTPGGGTSRMVTGLTSATLNIDTLSEGTCYDYYVTAHCAIGPLTQQGPHTFCTLCSPSPLPYLEDFNTSSWDCVLLSGSPSWISYNTQWAQAAFSTNINKDFVMDMRDVDVSANARLKFKWSKARSGANDAFVIRARLSGTNTWDTLWYQNSTSFQTNDGAWTIFPGSGESELIILDSAMYTGQIVSFQLLAHTSNSGADLFIDDFLVEAIPSCEKPQNGGNIPGTETTSSGAIYFTPGGATDFNLSYGDTSVVSSPEAGQYLMNLTNDTVSLSSLQPNTVYNVWVRDSCGVGDVSEWFGPIQFETECLPVTMPYSEDFGAWPPSCTELKVFPGGWGGAWDEEAGWARAATRQEGYRTVMEMPAIILTDRAKLEFKWSHMYISWALDEFYVLSRFNSAATWDTLWSRTGSAFESNDGAGMFNPGTGVLETINIPNGAAGDTLYIRFHDVPGDGPNTYLDDVYVGRRATVCDTASNVVATAIACDEVMLDWTDGQDSSLVEYGPAGFVSGTGTYLMDTGSVTIPGLMPGTAYDFYVGSVCGPDTLWANVSSATTPDSPKPSATVSSSRLNVNATTAEYSFVASGSDIDSVYWDFGNATANGDSVSMSFSSNGPVSVSVTASNGCGDTTFTYSTTIMGISVEENELTRSLRIYPNPSDGVLTVQFGLDTEEEVALTVINGLGQPVRVEELGRVTSFNGQLDLSDLPLGVYLIQVSTGTHVLYQRVTLQ